MRALLSVTYVAVALVVLIAVAQLINDGSEVEPTMDLRPLRSDSNLPATVVTAASARTSDTPQERAWAPAVTQNSFDPQSARDLHALFVHERSQDALPSLERASVALHLCVAYLNDAQGFRIAFSGGGGERVIGAVTPERQLASLELSRRCSGFERLPANDLAHLLQSIEKKLGQAGSRLSNGQQQESSSLGLSTVVALISAPNAESFERARPTLAASVSRAWGITDETDERAALDTALLLAACRFGRDCSASSFDALRRCTYQGVCNQGLFDNWQEGISATHVRRVHEYRQAVEHAIVSQSWRALGLDS